MRKMKTRNECETSLQIHGLEDEIGGLRQLDNFSRHETELLVVVKHGIHVLNPDGINGAIEDEPLAVSILEERRR